MLAGALAILAASDGGYFRTAWGAATLVAAWTLAVLLIAQPPALLSKLMAVNLLGFVGVAVATLIPGRDGGAALAEAREEQRTDRAFSVARFFFYSGTATMGALVLRPAGGFTLSDWLFFVAAAAVGARLVVGRADGARGFPTVLTVGVMFVVIGGVLSSFNAVDAASSMSLVIRFAYVTLIWFFVAAVVLRTTRHVERAVAWWCAAVGVSGAAAILQLVAGDVIPGAYFAWGRMSGLAEHVNDLGGMAAIALVPAFALATNVGSRRIPHLIAVAIVGLALAGLMLSGSVGGLAAAAAGFVAWIALRGISGRALVLTAVAAGALFGFVQATTTTSVSSPFARASIVTSAPGATDATLWSRIETNQRALGEIGTQPFVGVGLDTESSLTSTGYPVHNILLKPLYEAGLLGGIGMLLVLWTVVTLAAGTVRQAATDAEHRMACSLLCAFVSAFVFGLSAPILFHRYAWISALMIVALASVQARRGTAVTRASAVPARPQALPFGAVQ